MGVINIMKGIYKRLIGFLLILSLCFLFIPINVFGASDTVTIRVDVFDGATSKIIEGVGSFTVNSSRPGYVQSEDYWIPDLSTFTENSYGSISKVVGNWYFPSGTASVGTQVVWSMNNSRGRMMYYVSNWQPGDGSGGGGSTGTEDGGTIGSGSRYTWNQTVKYHSNYPDGTDYVKTFTYKVNSFTSGMTMDLKQPTELGFTNPNGYELASPPYNSKSDGTGESYSKIYYITNTTGTIDVYAQWVPLNSKEPEEEVTLTYTDNDVWKTQTFFKNDTATLIYCDKENDPKVFAGWDTDASADTVVYAAGNTLEMDSNKEVYAVWEEEVQDTIVLTYDANGGVNAPAADDSGVTEGSEATFTVSSQEPTREGFVFKGWSNTSGTNSVDYVSGNQIVTTTDKTIYAVWEEEVVDTIVLTYDANGGTNAPTADDSGKPIGESAEFTVSSQIPTWDGHKFLGWADSSIAIQPDYSGGDSLITTEDKTIYAVWEVIEDNGDKVSEPGMDKKADGSDSIGEVEVGDTITFTLNSHVGSDLKDSVSESDGVYTGVYDLLFKDTLSGSLSLNNDSFVVTVNNTQLSSNEYTLNTSPLTGETFTLNIDVVSLLNLGKFDFSAAGKAEVVVTYTATVTESEDGTVVENSASVNDSVVDKVTGEVVKEPTPPETGSTLSLIVKTIGICVVGAGCVMFVIKNKKKEM